MSGDWYQPDMQRPAAPGTEAAAYDTQTPAWQQHMQQAYAETNWWPQQAAMQPPYGAPQAMPGGYAGAMAEQNNLAMQAYFGMQDPSHGMQNAFSSSHSGSFPQPPAIQPSYSQAAPQAPPQAAPQAAPQPHPQAAPPAPRQEGAIPQTWMISNVPANWGLPGLMQNLSKYGIDKVDHYDCLCYPPQAQPNGLCLAFVNVVKPEASDRIQHFMRGLTRDSTGSVLEPPLQVKRAQEQGLMSLVQAYPSDSMFFCAASPQGVPTTAFTAILKQQQQQQSHTPAQPANPSPNTRPGSSVSGTPASLPVASPAAGDPHVLLRPPPSPFAPAPPPSPYAPATHASQEGSKPQGNHDVRLPSWAKTGDEVRPNLSLVDHVGPQSSGAAPNTVFPKQISQWTGGVEMQINAKRGTPKAEANSPEKNTSIMIMSLHRNTSPSLLVQYLYDQLGIIGGRDIDLLYLPVDFSTNLTKGYAIVNFRHTAVAKEIMEKGKLNVSPDGSEKWASFQWAQIQGSAANAQRFVKRHGHLRNARMRPLVWTTALASEGSALKNEDVANLS